MRPRSLVALGVVLLVWAMLAPGLVLDPDDPNTTGLVWVLTVIPFWVGIALFIVAFNRWRERKREGGRP